MTHDVLAETTREFRTDPLEPDRSRVRLELDITALDENGRETSFSASDYVAGDVEAWVQGVETDAMYAVFGADLDAGIEVYRTAAGGWGISSKAPAGTTIGRVLLAVEGNTRV